MSRKLKGNAIVSSSVTETQLSTDVVNKITNAYNQANSAYGQANNAAVRVTANSGTTISSNTISFNNTATVSVVVEANGSNANISFVAAPQTVVNDTYTAAGNVAAAATANIANGLYAIGTGAYAQANGAYAQANGAYAQANGAYAQANTTRDVANGAYAQANGAYAQANIAYGQANAAYGQANLAYEAANNSNLKLGGLITGTLNVTQDLIVGGNIYLEGNTTFINVATYSVEDSLIYLASNNDLTDSVDIGFMGGKNTSGTYAHTGLARDATDGKWKLFDGLADEGHVGNVVDFANTYLATLVANVEANSITVLGNAVATATNTAAAYAQANAAYDKSNVAANTVRVSQNSGSTLSAKQLNFVNTGNVKIVVSDSGNGNANISFDTTISGTNTSIISQTFSAASGAGNLQYALTYTPWAAEYVFVSKNGVTLLPATEFTLSGNTLTIIPTGETADSIEARYFVDVSLIPQSNTTIIIDANTVAAQTNTFYLSQSVSSINRIAVSKNGLRLTPNTHYSLTTANTVTLAAVAEIGDQLLFEYFYDLGNVTNIGDAFDQANAAYNAANTRVLKSGDTMTGTLNVQNVIPTTSNTYNLGSSSARFKDLWLSNSTIYLGEATISANGNALVIPSIESSSGNLSSNNVTAERLYGSNNNGDPIIILRNSAANNAISFNANTLNNYVHIHSNGVITASGVTSSGNLSSNNVTAERLYGSNNNGDPIIIIRNSAADNAITFNANTSNNYVHMHSNGVISASGITISGLNLVSQTAGAYGQANAAYGQANAAYGAANNRVLKAGDTMTGQLNISSGGLLVTGNVGIGTANPGKKLTVFSGTSGTFISGTQDSLRLQVDGYNNGARQSIEWFQDSGGGQVLGRFGLEWNQTADHMNFVWRDMYNAGLGSSEIMRLTGNGRLGIGTTNPSQQLELSGNIFINAAAGNPFIEIKTAGAGNNPYLKLTANTNYWELLGAFSQTNDDLLIRYNGTTFVNITNVGNVGVGTTGPSNARLVVTAGSAHTANTYFAARLNSSSYADNGNYTTMLGFGVEPATWSKAAIGFTRTSSYDVGYLGFYVNSDASGSSMVGLSDERMRISSAGIVTKQNQPFLYMDTIAGDAASGSVVVRYTNVRQSQGNTSYYNTSNGRYTAPVAGVYCFSWNYLYQSIGSTVQIDDGYTINGAFLFGPNRFTASQKSFGDGYCAIGNSITVRLNAGDYFEVKTNNQSVSGSSFYSNASWGYFTVYLVG